MRGATALPGPGRRRTYAEAGAQEALEDAADIADAAEQLMRRRFAIEWARQVCDALPVNAGAPPTPLRAPVQDEVRDALFSQNPEQTLRARHRARGTANALRRLTTAQFNQIVEGMRIYTESRAGGVGVDPAELLRLVEDWSSPPVGRGPIPFGVAPTDTTLASRPTAANTEERELITYLRAGWPQVEAISRRNELFSHDEQLLLAEYLGAPEARRNWRTGWTTRRRGGVRERLRTTVPDLPALLARIPSDGQERRRERGERRINDAELLEALRNGISDPDRGIELRPLTQEEIDLYLRDEGRALLPGRAINQRVANIREHVRQVRQALAAQAASAEDVQPSAPEQAESPLTEEQRAELHEWLNGTGQPTPRAAPAAPAPVAPAPETGNQLTSAQRDELNRWLRGED